MADIDQFILVITDEAMDRVCYETSSGTSGWQLKPFQFAISDTDLLEGYSDDQIFNEDGSVKDEIYELLQGYTTKNMENDAENIWCQLPFSGVTKISSPGTTLSHHIVIPADLTISGDSKLIKTIYYLYTDNNGNSFLYAIARANTYIVYETGLTQKYFFNFSVANAYEQALTEFVVNYSYPLEIQDHNTSTAKDIHESLLRRDGTRTVEDILYYNTLPDFTKNPSAELQALGVTKDMALVDKAYVDAIISQVQGLMDNMRAEMKQLQNEACPPGSMIWWPGKASTIPSGWTVRNGKQLKISSNPKLYALLGTKYNTGNETSGYFRIMNDNNLYIKGSTDDSIIGNSVAESCSVSIPHNGWSCAGGHGKATKGLLIAASGNSEIAEYLESIGAVNKNKVVSGTNINPKHRVYLPLIRLG